MNQSTGIKITERIKSPNESIMVSIVVAAYNHEYYIEKVINSFLEQITNFRVEITINDDASQDNTANIIKKFEKKYPDLFVCYYQNENQYSKGRKPWIEVLFPNARGKYIALCDGDDYWTDPLKLQKQVDFLEQNTNYCMCFTNVSVVDKYDNILKDRLFNHDKSEFHAINLFQKENPICTLTAMFKKEDLTDKIYVHNILNSQWRDRALWTSLVVNTKKNIGYLNEVCGAYRITLEGAYSGLSPMNIINKNIVFQKENLEHFGAEYHDQIKKTISQLTFDKFHETQKKSKSRGVLYFILNMKWIMKQNSLRDIIYVLRRS